MWHSWAKVQLLRKIRSRRENRKDQIYYFISANLAQQELKHFQPQIFGNPNNGNFVRPIPSIYYTTLILGPIVVFSFLVMTNIDDAKHLENFGNFILSRKKNLSDIK